MRGSGGKRRHGRGHKSSTGRTLGAWGFSSRQRAELLLAFGAATQFSLFLLWGEGRKEESKEGDLGGLAIKLFSCLALPEASASCLKH